MDGEGEGNGLAQRARGFIDFFAMAFETFFLGALSSFSRVRFGSLAKTTAWALRSSACHSGGRSEFQSRVATQWARARYGAG